MSNVSQLATPHLRTVTAVLPNPLRSVPAPPSLAEGVLRLPAGALIVPWPQAALPTELGGGEVPMVGYLVMVPAEQAAPVAAASAVAPVAAAAPPVAAAPLRAVPDAGADAGGSGGLRLDQERRTARLDGKLLELTYLEFELLAHFTAHPHRVHSRDHLVTAVWGYGHIGDGRTVDVHVARLRRKLGADYRGGIVTVRRVGYKYGPPKQG
jgi:hypothetical protein